MSSKSFIHFPWPCDIWRANEISARQAHQHECYEVDIRVRLLPKSAKTSEYTEDFQKKNYDADFALKSLWCALAKKLRAGTDGALLDGGSVIRREGADMIVVVSGGEDAVDSLSYTINVTLVETVRSILSYVDNIDAQIQLAVAHEGPGNIGWTTDRDHLAN